jgi:hypothetical protein
MSRKTSPRGQPEAATGAIAPLKSDPKYGFYPWWPEDGDGWVHPEDVKLARSLIPSPRIFKRDGERGEYVIIHYGPLKLRVKRTLWREAPWEGFDMGDMVEVMSRAAVNTWRTGTIREMRWNSRWNKIHYYIDEAGQPIPKAYSREDLRHVEPTPGPWDAPPAQPGENRPG